MYTIDKTEKVLVLYKDDVDELVDTMCKGSKAIEGAFDAKEATTVRFTLLELAYRLENEMEE